MGLIRELPPSVINQIAAGEVVERPASVLKELLENAIDAGATRVEVSVERGGKDLVRVADNGRGIDAEDLPLAFRPHATSKLRDVEDLHRISTLGFRGEALAAIAEVSRVRCQSRTADSPDGHELEIEAGTHAPIKPWGGSVGTIVEVRNLFFNTPVRRTFLRADATEAGHVIEMFQRIALAHPTVQLAFRSGNKVLYDLPAVTGLRERVAVFFGQELADNLLWVESRIEQTHLWGYVAHPSQSRSSTKGQYLFIAGRYVRDRSLGHALGEAYRGLLMVGRSPVAFLHLEIPPDEVDVNVHPTKIEVRFRDGQKIYSQLLATVRQTFLSSDLHARLQTPPEEAAAPPVTPRWEMKAAETARQEVASWFAPKAEAPFRTFPEPGYAGGPAGTTPWARPVTPFPQPPPPSVPADRFDEFHERPSTPPPPPDPSPGIEKTPAERPVRALQLHDSYLVVETDEGMVVIDQHALHERILFEEFRARVARGGLESQRLLVPSPVDMTADEAAELLERRDVLTELGLTIDVDDGGMIVVSSVPALLGDASPERLVRDLADHCRTHALAPTRDALLGDLLSLMACKAAIKAGQKLSRDEIDALLQQRHLAHDAHHCPHGRPTALTFTRSELERQFGRT